MTQATILLMSTHARREWPGFSRGDERPTTYAKTAYQTGNYEAAGTIEVDQVGEAAAEEVFDLTNNPARQDEREARYGRGRSVSTGDIVRVDGVDYLCNSVGWTQLWANIT